MSYFYEASYVFSCTFSVIREPFIDTYVSPYFRNNNPINHDRLKKIIPIRLIEWMKPTPPITVSSNRKSTATSNVNPNSNQISTALIDDHMVVSSQNSNDLLCSALQRVLLGMYLIQYMPTIGYWFMDKVSVILIEVINDCCQFTVIFASISGLKSLKCF